MLQCMRISADFVKTKKQRWLGMVVTVVPIIAFSFFSPPVGTNPTGVGSPASAALARFRPGELLVKLMSESQVRTVRFYSAEPLESVRSDFLKNPKVEYAEPNYLVHLSAFDPNDVYYPQQWYLRQIAAPLAWERTTGSPDVVVAVIDSGVDINHPDLKANIWRNPGEVEGDGQDNDGNGFADDVRGWDFIDSTNDPRPDATPPYSRTALNHGTLVAGIITAVGNNVEGVSGVAWHTRIMPLRVLDSNGQGDVEAVARAVDYAVNNGAGIINLSFVGSGYSQRLYDALQRAYRKNVVIVSAAGNLNESVNGSGDLDEHFLYPVCYDAADVVNKTNWLLGVTATDTLDQRAPFANVGSRCVDIAAPGVSMFGAQVYDLAKGLPEAYGGGWSGTSLAVPLVSGVAALVRAAYPKLTNVQVIQVLLSSSDNIDRSNQGLRGKIGVGRINASRALSGAAVPGKAPPLEATTVGGRVVAMVASGFMADVKLLSGKGELKTGWSAYAPGFRGGGSVAVSESSRFLPASNSARLSAVIRGEQRVVVGEGQGGEGRVVVYDLFGRPTAGWRAFDSIFRGGVSVAAGDIYGTGDSTIVVVPLSGGGPQVRMFDQGGRLKGQFFAYDKSVRGGFSLAVADVDDDGKSEIIASSNSAYLPVRIFQSSGKLISEWYPYPEFRGGVNVAAGDLEGTGVAGVVTVPVRGGASELKIFDLTGKLHGQFPVFARSFRGGLNLGVGDIDGDGRDEIVAAPASLGGPQVRIFTSRGRLIGQFFAYDQRLRSGLTVAVLR